LWLNAGANLVNSFYMVSDFLLKIEFFLIPFGFGRPGIRFNNVFSAFLLHVLRSFFALPSLQGRDDNIGFRGIGIKRSYVFAACRAGYRGGAEADFMQG